MSLKNTENQVNILCGKIQKLNKKINGILTINTIPNLLVVSSNGGTPYKTINNAIDYINNNEFPSEFNKFVIYATPGLYKENIILPNYVDLIGFGDSTIITPENLDEPVIILQNYSNLEDLRIEI